MGAENVKFPQILHENLFQIVPYIYLNLNNQQIIYWWLRNRHSCFRYHVTNYINIIHVVQPLLQTKAGQLDYLASRHQET